MTSQQKTQQENYFKMVLKHSNENGCFVWYNANASYTIENGKFKPVDKHSRKMMVSTTGKTFQQLYITK